VAASIVATGDVMPQRPLDQSTAGLLAAGDLAFVNLEGR
jgi:hypothetical protein